MFAPPTLDPARVATLTDLAARLDGGDASTDGELVTRFNTLAGTQLTFEDFQGIYGAEEHEDFVTRRLIEQATNADPTLDRAAMRELVQGVLDHVTDDRRLTHASASIEKTLGEDGLSDAIFWPDLFFGHGDVKREHTADEIVDELLRRHATWKARGPILL